MRTLSSGRGSWDREKRKPGVKLSGRPEKSGRYPGRISSPAPSQPFDRLAHVLLVMNAKRRRRYRHEKISYGFGLVSYPRVRLLGCRPAAKDGRRRARRQRGRRHQRFLRHPRAVGELGRGLVLRLRLVPDRARQRLAPLQRWPMGLDRRRLDLGLGFRLGMDSVPLRPLGLRRFPGLVLDSRHALGPGVGYLVLG